MLFSQLMARKILFFYNPISGTKSKQPLLDKIEMRCKKEQINFEIRETSATADYTYLSGKIEVDNITDIVVCGGDGTINEVASAILGTTVNIGIIPMGSGNGLALAAGISTNANKALDTIFKNNPVAIDGFFINTHFSCMLCGLGFDAQVAHDFAKQKKRGLLTYVEQSLRNFFAAKP